MQNNEAGKPLGLKFLTKVKYNSENGCIEWIGAKNKQTGYGILMSGGRNVHPHRVAYEIFIGKIPPGLVIDHLCRNHICVNPWHLEPVTSGENVLRGISPVAKNARKVKCVQGHSLSGENLKFKYGWRICVTCQRSMNKQHMRSKRAKLALNH